VSDIDTAAADSLKVLDPKRPIREADIRATVANRLLETYRRHGRRHFAVTHKLVFSVGVRC
jgi:hypothetical protein